MTKKEISRPAPWKTLPDRRYSPQYPNKRLSFLFLIFTYAASLPLCAFGQTTSDLQIQSGAAAVAPLAGSAPSEIPSRPQKKINYFRREQGVELPLPYPTATPLVNAEAIRERTEQIVAHAKSTPIEIEKMRPKIAAPLLLRCQTNQTKTQEVSEANFPGGIAGNLSPLYDILFIEAAAVAPDYEDLYGATVSLIPVALHVPDMSWGLVRDFKVPCLPYRVRVQRDKIYTDEGIHALKNYDSHPTGTLIKDRKRIDGALNE